MSLAALRDRQPGRPLWRVFWWHLLHLICYLWVGPCYAYRSWGKNNIPATGPVLFVSNHQSYLDPILVGLGAHHRQFYAMARATLFHHPLFSWLINSLNAIPVNQHKGDMTAMRRCIEVLRQGHALLIFPEGSRTPDGAIHKFKPGTLLVIKRARPMVVPVALEGAFDAWRVGTAWPRPCGHVGVVYGQPIPAEKLVAMGEPAALEYLRQVIEQLRRQLLTKLCGDRAGSASATGDGESATRIPEPRTPNPNP